MQSLTILKIQVMAQSALNWFYYRLSLALTANKILKLKYGQKPGANIFTPNTIRIIHNKNCLITHNQKNKRTKRKFTKCPTDTNKPEKPKEKNIVLYVHMF